jgi:hypothetical protein
MTAIGFGQSSELADSADLQIFGVVKRRLNRLLGLPTVGEVSSTPAPRV